MYSVANTRFFVRAELHKEFVRLGTGKLLGSRV